MSTKISFIKKISIGALLIVTALFTFLLTLGVGFIIGSMITAGIITIFGTVMSPLGLGIISAAVAVVLLLPFMIVCQDSMERLYETTERRMKDSSKPNSPNKGGKSIEPSTSSKDNSSTSDSSAPQ